VPASLKDSMHGVDLHARRSGVEAAHRKSWTMFHALATQRGA